MKKHSAISQGAPGPNPHVVQAIFERVAEWKAEQEAKSKTEEVYQPIVDHYEAHRIAIENMTAAIRKGDSVETEKYFNEATYHEQMQREAGTKARQYFLSKAQHTVQS